MKYRIEEGSFMAPRQAPLPEQRLLGAIILRALRDYLEGGEAGEEAAAWFSERGPRQHEKYFTFCFICELLDLDPDKIWNKIQDVRSTQEELCPQSL